MLIAERAVATGVGPYRFTSEQYHLMDEAGVFPPDTRVELLDGVIYEMAAIGAKHLRSVWRLHKRLAGSTTDVIALLIQLPIRLEDGSEPIPDLMLVRAAFDEGAARLPTPGDALLLVEIADSSAHDDLRVKALRYSATLIPEYWVYLVASKTMVVHRGPDADGYRSVVRYGPGEPIAPLAMPDCAIDPGELV